MHETDSDSCDQQRPIQSCCYIQYKSQRNCKKENKLVFINQIAYFFSILYEFILFCCNNIKTQNTLHIGDQKPEAEAFRTKLITDKKFPSNKHPTPATNRYLNHQFHLTFCLMNTLASFKNC